MALLLSGLVPAVTPGVYLTFQNAELTFLFGLLLAVITLLYEDELDVGFFGERQMTGP